MKRLLGIISFVSIAVAALVAMGGPVQAVPPAPPASQPLPPEATTPLASGWLEVLTADTIIQVGTASVSPGDDFFVPVTVRNIPPSPNGLRSYQLTIDYISSVLTVTQCTAGNDYFGSPSTCDRDTPGRVRIVDIASSCYNYGGDLLLIYLQGRATGAGGASTPLTVTLYDLYDCYGNTITPTSAVNGRVTILGPTPTPTPTSTPTATATSTPTPTSTPTVTPTVTPTATPVPGAGFVVGQVDLQGRSDESGALVTLGDSAYSATTATDGAFTITGVAAGTYILMASMPGYLYAQRTGIVVTAGEVTILPALTLRGGDINGDGTVNIFDLVLVGANYGLAAPRPWP